MQAPLELEIKVKKLGMGTKGTSEHDIWPWNRGMLHRSKDDALMVSPARQGKSHRAGKVECSEQHEQLHGH
jgi:hypothetical protein